MDGPFPYKPALTVSEAFSKTPFVDDWGLFLWNHQRVLVLKVVVVEPAMEPGSGRGQSAKSISLRKRRSWPRRVEGEAQMTSDEETRASRNHSHRARASQPQDQGLALRRRNSMPCVSLRVWLGSSARVLLKRKSMVRRPRSRKARRFTCLMRLSWRRRRSRLTRPRNTFSERVRIRLPCRKSWLRLMRSEKMSSCRK